MTFDEILKFFREADTQVEKGKQFEKLMRNWLLTDPRYNTLQKVWLWSDFPARDQFGTGHDVGIDLVAQNEFGEYWAIQCKCYKETTPIALPSVTNFIAASNKKFIAPDTGAEVRFAHRLWVSTTDNWTTNAEEALEGQEPAITRISLFDLQTSPVKWEEIFAGKDGKEALQDGKKPREHQLNALSAAEKYFQTHDRGKLIMACGTGKTYTSLYMMESMLNHKGLVLFLVPSISLLGQTLNEWSADARKPIKSICICSDATASRKNKKANEDDLMLSSVVDLALPATTDKTKIAKQLMRYRNHDGLVVIFSTYQSISAVHDAQQEILRQTNNNYGIFDFIVCDEAHRTTGTKVKDATVEDESEFTRVHNNEFIIARKRLYMTATPRIFADSVKAKATDNDFILFSMDNKEWYGEEIFRVGFGYAVEHGLLTDYKVFVLTINEDDLPSDLRRQIQNNKSQELKYDDAAKLVGVVSGLSKIIKGDEGQTWQVDPRLMKRALAFCSKIGNEKTPGTSKNIQKILPYVSEMVYADAVEEQKDHIVRIETEHVDGSMSSVERAKILHWLASENPHDPQECRVITNVRCLSEGVDVPALDAVIFLSPRNSQVDVVQSVGRVMRNFAKGTDNEKKYGYIIIPVVVPNEADPDKILQANDFKTVWSILNALRSHDDRFNALVNKIQLNKKRPDKITIGKPGIASSSAIGISDGSDADDIIQAGDLVHQLQLQFGEFEDKVYAKLVDKVGDKMYWENWAKEIGRIAQEFVARINRLLIESDDYRRDMHEFVTSLQRDLNPAVDQEQAIEMLAQHMIIKPVFDALFADYEFVKNNSVSRSMEAMLQRLHNDAFEKDTKILSDFYESVRMNVRGIDNLEGKQTIIKNLYEKFFAGAFPLTVEKLGIVYTPIECVDFIIHSVESILNKEFNSSLSAEGVHVLDPFTGTGTFITRLLQSGIISKEDLERKYLNEIHCNEIVLLAYYVADVNIEAVFHDLTKRTEYLPYENICLTDTFQLSEPEHNVLFTQYFRENTAKVKKLKKTHLRVIIGNPPYSVGQKSAEDNAENLKYEKLENRLSDTYIANTSNNPRSLYDSYIKAFRWASDRIPDDEGGVVAFISNGAWLDGNAQDGMRKCLSEEFTSIYVLNLRGNQRTSGELSRKEGGKIFGSGSRTPIAITFLVKNPKFKRENAKIFYHDIGDYLSRDEKLKIIRDFKSIDGVDWQIIQPNEKHDWINQRDGVFDGLFILGNKDSSINNSFFMPVYTCGVKTNRDVWCYNYNKDVLTSNIEKNIDYYNSQCDKILKKEIIEVESSPTQFSWSYVVKNRALKGQKIQFSEGFITEAMYRPFNKHNFYFGKNLNENQYLVSKSYNFQCRKNLWICVTGVGVNKDFSALITDNVPDVQILANGQCFPLYWYEENTRRKKELSLFGDDHSNEDYIRYDGITDWILTEVRRRYSGTKYVTKEHIFYYVYGILHSPQYRERFADDLKKSLPRIPIVEKIEDFITISKIGRELAELHLNYETIPAHSGVNVTGDPYSFPDDFELDKLGTYSAELEKYYRIYDVDKMSFAKVRNEEGKLVPDKSTIIYNHNIRITNIPLEAYEYVVNGKSAIEWLIERYAITTDKASGIVNNPNDWAREHSNPKYILRLVLSIIALSIKTNELVASLPKLNL